MKRYKPDVVFFQETHCTKDDECIWSTEWGNTCIFSNGASNACGVAIMFTKNIGKEIKEVRRDIDGQYLFCKLTINGYSYCLSNLYAPNSDSPNFFHDIFKHMQELNVVYSIIGGDFNVVQDPVIDCSSNCQYNKNAMDVITSHMESDDLVDIWRNNNPEAKKFTWCTRPQNRFRWSQIDYFLISSSLVPKCTESDILPSINRDHSAVTLKVDTTEVRCGPGSWKFNNDLLKETEFVDNLRLIVQGVKQVYHYMDPIALWELLKFKISQYSKEYTRAKAQQQKAKSFQAYEKFSNMQDEMLRDFEINGYVDSQLQLNMDIVKKEIDHFQEEDTCKAAFRCKMQYTIEGEKHTKYFFNMEKHKYLSKTMYMTRKASGELTKDYSEKLEVQYCFYEKLYRKDPCVKFDIENSNGVCLDNQRTDHFDNGVQKQAIRWHDDAQMK